MATNTYWLADPDGTLVAAEGAAERDRLAGLGWVLADEPRTTDRVWHYNAEVRGWAAFPAESLPAWQARGWAPAVPPLEQGDVGPFVALPDPGDVDGAPQQATPEVKAEPEATPKTETKKETKSA